MAQWDMFNNNSAAGGTYFSKGMNIGNRPYNGFAWQVTNPPPPPPQKNWVHIKYRAPKWRDVHASVPPEEHKYLKEPRRTQTDSILSDEAERRHGRSYSTQISRLKNWILSKKPGEGRETLKGIKTLYVELDGEIYDATTLLGVLDGPPPPNG